MAPLEGRADAPPLLPLLHGFPQTHVMWHRVAHRLAEHFRPVLPDLPDLRGYGDSEAAPTHAGSASPSRRPSPNA
jgi:haloacetate dehalogenase